MTPLELKELEEQIKCSFIRANVLSVADATEHATLAIAYMKNALRFDEIKNIKPLLSNEAIKFLRQQQEEEQNKIDEKTHYNFLQASYDHR